MLVHLKNYFSSSQYLEQKMAQMNLNVYALLCGVKKTLSADFAFILGFGE